MATRRILKAERMELRQKLGFRGTPRVPTIASAGPYRVREAHACFSCRVSFKIEPRERSAACPNCGGSLVPMGRAFKAPRKSDMMQWRKVEKLWLAGYRFPTNWAHNAMPGTLREVDAFIAANPAHPNRLVAFIPPRLRRERMS